MVVVTKTIAPSQIEAAFHAGIRHFGENRIQEAEAKLGQLQNLNPRPTWHLVGHLQTNKAKTALELFDIIQSVDSIRLAEVLSRRARRAIPVLLEVNIGGEESKFGLSEGELFEAVEQTSRLPNIEVNGLMTIAPLVADPEEVRPVFRRLRHAKAHAGGVESWAIFANELRCFPFVEKPADCSENGVVDKCVVIDCVFRKIGVL